jgi:hypothetical protein
MDSSLLKKASQGFKGPFVCNTFRMGPVKNSSHPVKKNPDPRASAFFKLSTQCNEQLFNVIPLDICPHRVFKNIF